MLISVSMTREMNERQLQKVLSVKNPTTRVLFSLAIKDTMSTATYVYVTADDEGDYSIHQADLRLVSLTTRQYAVKQDRELESGLQSLWEAKQRISRMKGGKSLSGGRPLQAITFPLSMLGMQGNPNLEQVLYNWCHTQDIIPLRYASYDQDRDCIELGLVDPGARNSSVRMRIIEQGVFSELKAFLARHPEIGTYDKDRLDQLTDPNNLDLRPEPIVPEYHVG